MAKKKEILLGIKEKCKETNIIHIVGCTDNLNPLFIYFNDYDSGDHYYTMGNAVKRIRQYAKAWKQNGVEFEEIYGAADDIPVHGCSEWNKAMFKHNYCGAEYPDTRKYYGY